MCFVVNIDLKLYSINLHNYVYIYVILWEYFRRETGKPSQCSRKIFSEVYKIGKTCPYIGEVVLQKLYFTLSTKEKKE